MAEIVQVAINGIAVGGIYALVAMGVALIFGIMDVPQFALGSQGMLAAYIGVVCMSGLDVGYGVAIVLAVVFSGLLGGAVYQLVFRPLGRAGFRGFIAAFGLSLILESAALLIFGTEFRQMRSPLGGRVAEIAGVVVAYQRLLVITVASVAALAVWVFLGRTRYGRAMRALAQNETGALVVGVHPQRINLLAMVIASALAGLAACLVAPLANVNPNMGLDLIVKAFVVTILGGLGSVPGAVVGGVALGLIEAFGAAYVDVDYTNTYGFLLLILVLMAKPAGLMGSRA